MELLPIPRAQSNANYAAFYRICGGRLKLQRFIANREVSESADGVDSYRCAMLCGRSPAYVPTLWRRLPFSAALACRQAERIFVVQIGMNLIEAI